MSCFQCKYQETSYFQDGHEGIKCFLEGKRIIPENIIPKWCPLDDYTQDLLVLLEEGEIAQDMLENDVVSLEEQVHNFEALEVDTEDRKLDGYN